MNDFNDINTHSSVFVFLCMVRLCWVNLLLANKKLYLQEYNCKNQECNKQLLIFRLGLILMTFVRDLIGYTREYLCDLPM